jgi:hypothetical protein
VPLKHTGRLPAVVALHGTFKQGKERAAGLVDNPEKVRYRAPTHCNPDSL